MALIFNPEDKIQWEEWAPSLQDRLKAIFAKIYAGSMFIFKYLGNIRITIGERQPVNPVLYREIWWDTRFEVFRVLTSEGWVMTRATWYDGSNDNIQNDATSPISLNPRTNCHCYTISWNNSYYCHCKTQSSKAPSVPVNKVTDLGFNLPITSSAPATKYYKFIISSTAQATYEQIIFQSLNITDVNAPNEGAIIDITDGGINRVTSSDGSSQKYVTYDPKYAGMFSSDYNSTTAFVQGQTYYIPIKFAEDKKIDSVFGTLTYFSSGPVTILLQASYDNGATYDNIASVTLKGNYQAAIICHGSCHCARW